MRGLSAHEDVGFFKNLCSIRKRAAKASGQVGFSFGARLAGLGLGRGLSLDGLAPRLPLISEREREHGDMAPAIGDLD